MKQQATYEKLQRQLNFIAELRLKAVLVLCFIGAIFSIATTATLLLLHDESVLTSNLIVVEQERTLTQQIVSDSNVVIESGDQGYQQDLTSTLQDWTTEHNVLLARLGPNERSLLHTADASYNALQQQVASLVMEITPAPFSPTDVQMRFEMYSLQGQADIYTTAIEHISGELEGYTRSDTLRIYQTTIVTGVTLALTLALVWLVVFRPAIQRLHSNILDITKTEHEVREILVEAQRSVDDIEPLVTEVIPGTYTVQNGSNGVYFVHYMEGHGFCCSCPWYKRTGVCLHTRWAHTKQLELITTSSGDDSNSMLS